MEKPQTIFKRRLVTHKFYFMAAIADIRKEYMQEILMEKDADPHPIRQFDKWWQQAIDSKIDEVNAMTLATVKSGGIPSARIVLLKGYDDNGFVFFTNYESDKGNEMALNPNVSLVFFWKELERQVRIEGKAVKISNEQSDEYFNSRPMESRIGAWASTQSKVIASREELKKNIVHTIERFQHEEMYRPPHWGGYVVEPQSIEFWQGRPGRLHDRILYTRIAAHHWKQERLSP